MKNFIIELMLSLLGGGRKGNRKPISRWLQNILSSHELIKKTKERKKSPFIGNFMQITFFYSSSRSPLLFCDGETKKSFSHHHKEQTITDLSHILNCIYLHKSEEKLH
jgi:hypothetical protein